MQGAGDVATWAAEIVVTILLLNEQNVTWSRQRLCTKWRPLVHLARFAEYRSVLEFPLPSRLLLSLFHFWQLLCCCDRIVLLRLYLFFKIPSILSFYFKFFPWFWIFGFLKISNGCLSREFLQFFGIFFKIVCPVVILDISIVLDIIITTNSEF